ncbi:hypothetical protein EV360DRAFT_71516 [Lentinula raphanica]|nr:hypothetical protein EV360DRAFT_71516 [Lentinula raphanica]
MFLRRVCHPYWGVLLASLLCCTTLYPRMFAFASPITHPVRRAPGNGEYNVKLAWKTPGEAKLHDVTEDYTGQDLFLLVLSGYKPVMLEPQFASILDMHVVEIPVTPKTSHQEGDTVVTPGPSYALETNLLARFGNEAFFKKQLAIITDIRRLMDEINGHFMKKKSTRFIMMPKDDLDWIHTVLMYWTIVEYEPGKTVLQEEDVRHCWYEKHWKEIKRLRQTVPTHMIRLMVISGRVRRQVYSSSQEYQGVPWSTQRFIEKTCAIIDLRKSMARRHGEIVTALDEAWQSSVQGTRRQVLVNPQMVTKRAFEDRESGIAEDLSMSSGRWLG